MGRRLRVVLGESTLAVAPPEYVIVRKLEYFREGGSIKHLDDIRAMLRNSGDSLDKSALEGFIATLGLAREWAQVGTPTNP
jgi:hypothetical protein